MHSWKEILFLYSILLTLTYGDEELKTTFASETRLNQDKDNTENNNNQTENGKQKIVNADIQIIQDLTNDTKIAESISHDSKQTEKEVTSDASNKGDLVHNYQAMAAGMAPEQLTQNINETENNNNIYKRQQPQLFTEETKTPVDETVKEYIDMKITKKEEQLNSKNASDHVVTKDQNNKNEAIPDEFVEKTRSKNLYILRQTDNYDNNKMRVAVKNSKNNVEMNRNYLVPKQENNEVANKGHKKMVSQNKLLMEDYENKKYGVDTARDKDVIRIQILKAPDKFRKRKLRRIVGGLGNRRTLTQSFIVKSKGNKPNDTNNLNRGIPNNSNVTNDAEEDKKFDALKKELVESIMNKTSALVIKITKSRYPSDAEKQRVLEIVKAKVLNKVSPLSERYKLWADVITKGVDTTFMRLRLLKGYKSEKTAFRRNDNIETEHVTKKEPVVIATFDPLAKKANVSQPIPCDVLIQRACTKFNALNTLPCENGNSSVTMEKLCDGIYDCEDGSDEIKCSDKAIKKLKIAEKSVEEAESHKFIDCLKYDDSYLAKKKSDSLKKVIANQVGLIAHCIDSPLVKTSLQNQIRNRMVLEQAANQIAIVISSVSTSLDGAICSEQIRHIEDFDYVIKRVDEHDEQMIEVVDDENAEEWTFRICKCSGRLCMPHPCDENCKKICENKHALGRMMCRSFNRETSISLDLICDGKIDCVDESDESNCNEGNSYARFEGFNAFGRVGENIQSKIQSKYYSAVRSNLFSLHKAVNQLRKLNANLAVDKQAVKSARNRAFGLLGSIYVDMLTKVESFNETEKIFVFLMSIHDELIGALKHCHTGNERVVPSEDCSCRDTVCNVPFCPSYCVRACAVEPIFMQLTCKNYPGKKVALSNICDGTKDCPLGDDEKLCDHDMCRKHHFLLLYTKLDKEISTGKGQNLLGEILKAWKKKAILTAKTAEVAVVPTRNNFKQIVRKLLHELVMAYSFTDEIKGGPQELYNTFYNLSQQVIKLVNYCGTY